MGKLILGQKFDIISELRSVTEISKGLASKRGWVISNFKFYKPSRKSTGVKISGTCPSKDSLGLFRRKNIPIWYRLYLRWFKEHLRIGKLEDIGSVNQCFYMIIYITESTSCSIGPRSVCYAVEHHSAEITVGNFNEFSPNWALLIGNNQSTWPYDTRVR